MDSTRTIALTYRRVSTYRQEREGVSLDVQNDQCLDYIRRQQGWRLGGDFQDTLTGRTAKRPNYQRLLEEARQLSARGERVAVVTAALDRMGRDLEESVRSRKELKALDVLVHCIREGGVLQELQADIYASIAADESRRIGARVKGTRKRQREHGWPTPSRPSWGYIWAEPTERERLAGAPKLVLRSDPETAEYAREAWRRVAAGETVRQVALWAETLHSEARGGRKLDFANVLRMFKNPAYIARVAEPKRKVRAPDLAALQLPSGRWEALVDDATWTAVHQQIAGHQRVPRQARGEYLLTGIIRCPRCGLRMQGRRVMGGNQMTTCRPARAYSCGTPTKGCWFSARADDVEHAVFEAIERRLRPVVAGNTTVQRAMRAEWARLQQPTGRPKRGRGETLERVIAKARRRQDEMLSLLADRVISRDKYDRGIAAEQLDIDGAEAELAEIRSATPAPTLPPFDEVLAELGDWSLVLAGDVVPEQRSVLVRFVEHVVPRRIGHGKYEVDITWTPLGAALGALTERVA